MKRFVFVFVALTCTLFAAIASADVGTDRGTPLQTYAVSAQPVFILPAIVVPVSEYAPVVCTALDRQYAVTGLTAKVAKPDPFVFIDPGIYAQVSNSIGSNYTLLTIYSEPIRSTARHV